MSLKQVILGLVALLILCLIGVGGWLGYQFTRPVTSFTVQESTERKVSPNEATINFTAIGRDKIQSVASEKNKSVVNDVNSRLQTKFKIPINQIKTTQYSSNNVIRYDEKGQPLEKEWLVSTNYQLSIKDLEKNKELLENLNGEFSGATEPYLTGIENYYAGDYKVANLEQICDQLEVELIQKLKTSIDSKLNVFGGTSVGVSFEINKEQCKNNFGGYPTFKSAVAPAELGVGGAGSGTEAFLGEQKVQLSGQATVRSR
jgi:hypothetical protein